MTVGAAGLTAVIVLAACSGKSGVVAVSADSIAPPASDAAAPQDYRGLHNVVAYSEGLYSGSVPEGDAGFDTLASMGIRTIISVDGAQPELDLAKARAMRYVHLPIGYDGMSNERTLEIARAIRDLPGPVYVHCHHGKHRSAGAAGAAAVTLGRMTNDEAVARMHVSGTSPNYQGLYQCVSVAQAADAETLESVSDEFPEYWQTSGLVQAMVEIDHGFEHLKSIERAGWCTPPAHPDLVPAAEAGRLADLMRYLQDDQEAKDCGGEFIEWLLDASKLAGAIERGLIKGADAAILSAQMQQLTGACKQCHMRYRDAI